MSAICTSTSFPTLLPSAARSGTLPPAARHGAWQLCARRALSLQATRASVLRVRQGRLWVTRDATVDRGSEDLVVAPGESISVPGGQRIVLEPWDGQGASYTWDAA